MSIQVALINHSKLDDAEVMRAKEALQTQVDSGSDFALAWDRSAQLDLVAPGKEKDLTTSWRLYLVETDLSRPWDLEGFHDNLGDDTHLPVAYVAVGDGKNWTNTASHE